MGLEKIKTKSKIKTDKLILKLDKILLEKEEREEDESIDKIKMSLRYTRFYFYIFISLFLITYIFTIYNSIEYESDKLIFLREQFARKYYRQDDLNKKIKETLGKYYVGDFKTDFDNYVLVKTTNDIRQLDNEKWTKYTGFVPKENYEKITEDSKKIAGAAEYKALNDNTYYVKFGQFTTGITSNKFKEHMESMKNYKNIIFDLRENGGGNLRETRLILDNLIDKGKIIYQESRVDKVKKFKSKKNKKLDFDNIIILTNEGTASSSELFALSMKENLSNVTIIGDVTFGKGIGQYYHEFDDGSALIYTTMTWEGPSGKSILNKGITPNITVKNDNKKMEEKQQLDKALEIINKSKGE
ncbi:MAG: S41 family peptidase [Peptostreptococcaceae bacterium]|nr:S41 family peptidase [Peptostreptococcaceae bacterium]